MPPRDWFAVPFTLENLLTACHLRIFPITNLETGAYCDDLLYMGLTSSLRQLDAPVGVPQRSADHRVVEWELHRERPIPGGHQPKLQRQPLPRGQL
jgi:hypothetical protein